MLTWPTCGVPPGGAASAAQQTTYTGVFAGHIIDEGCATTPHPATTTGSWSITLHGTSAKGTFHILVNGLPHVSYVYPNMDLVGSTTDSFSVSGMTGAGLLPVTLTDNGNMTYTIAPYNYNGLSCTSVTYPGHT